MKLKRSISFLMAGLLLVAAAGCSAQPADSGIATDAATVNPIVSTDESIHIRDKALLYEQQDNTQIVTMYLTVSTGNAAEGTDHTWEEINTYSVYDYERMGVDRYQVAGLLQIGDANGIDAGELGYGQVSPNCTVQIRGQSSSLNTQKNYKISIKDNKGDWRGQQTIALNKHQSEGMRFRNKLGFDLLSEIDPLMSLRTTFVHLYVKDTTEGGSGEFEDYGLYTQVEQLNKTALEAHGLDKRGHLYKINFCEFYRYEDAIRLKDDPMYDLKKFEEILEIKGDDDHTKLISLLEKINDYSIPIEEILQEHFDIENITYWMAFNILTGNIDTQSRNFYLYSPQNTERWYILSWDNDAMLKRAEYDLLGRTDFSAWESGISNYWGNILFRRCLKSDLFLTELDKAIIDLHASLPDRIAYYTDLYASFLKPHIYSGRDALYAPLTDAEYDTVAETLADEIETNYSLYEESLAKPMPFYIGTPQKTDGGITVEWEASYDFGRETITYTFELARDYTFTNPIIKKQNLTIPVISCSALPQGQYFMRVTAENESGQTQTAFDYYVIDAGKVYGTKCFYVNADGSISEDVYVEG